MNTLKERIALAWEVKSARERARGRDISQVEMAEAVGVKPPSVNDWFTGETKSLKAATALAAARFLGCDAEWLSTGRGPRPALDDDASTSPAYHAPARMAVVAPPRVAIQYDIDAEPSPERRRLLDAVLRLTPKQEAAVLALLETFGTPGQPPRRKRP